MKKEVLEKYIADKFSIGQIAVLSKKSKTTIRYWLKKYSLKTVFIEENREVKIIALKEAVLTSSSFAEVCRKLKRLGSGSGYQNLKADIHNNNIDTSHFKTSNPYNIGVKIEAEKILVYNRNSGKRESTARLRRALFQIGKDLSCCSVCGQSNIWNGIVLTMQIDHIDGIRINNLPDNLRVLCPNCHTQTSTFGYKQRN